MRGTPLAQWWHGRPQGPVAGAPRPEVGELRPGIVALLGLLLLTECRAAAPAPVPSPAATARPDPGFGVDMACGIRGQLLDSFAAPRFFTQVATMTLDRSARVSTHSDAQGRFALPGGCQRLYAVAGRNDSGVAYALVSVQDEAVDVDLQVPARGDEIHVRPEHLADALRLRVLQLAPPAVLRDGDVDPDSAERMAHLLAGPLAGTEFVAGLDLPEVFVDP